MKKHIYLTLLLTIFTLYPEQKHILLESNLLKLVDGFIINANTIELIRNYQRNLLHIIYGTKESDGTRRGDYEFKNKRYTIHDLTQIEQDLHKKKSAYSEREYEQLIKQLKSTLLKAKDDFVEKSKHFRTIGAGSKHITSKLIEDSCKKRGRKNSILLIYSSVPEDQEDQVVYKEAHSFLDFEQFIIDLLNFLDDLIHSCPKAQEKFRIRLQKWTKLKEILPSVLSNSELNSHFETEFLKYFKEQHIDTHAVEHINQALVSKLVQDFKKTHS